MAQYASGYIEGGAARNVECGFWPEYVRVLNVTDQDTIYEGHLTPIIEFDGGGGTGLEILPGDNIRASDAGWSAVVQEVVLMNGSWSGGNAEGYLILVPGSVVNASAIADNDNIAVSRQKGGAYSGNYATVDDADGLAEAGITVATTVAALDGFILYTSATASRGFTTPSLGANNELLFWQAFGPGVG